MKPGELPNHVRKAQQRAAFKREFSKGHKHIARPPKPKVTAVYVPAKGS